MFKIYTVGPEYAHAEARKSPSLDGKVERDSQGKEIRYPVILNPYEKEIAHKVCKLFKVSYIIAVIMADDLKIFHTWHACILCSMIKVTNSSKLLVYF